MLKMRLSILTKFFVIIVLIFISFGFCNISNINAESTLSKYNKELNDVVAKEKENMNKLTGVQRELAEYNYEIAELDSKMMETTLDLADLKNKEENLIKSLKENEDALKDTSKLYQKAEDAYAKRLRAIYENGVPNIVEFLFSSRGVLDFIAKVNAYQSVLEYNKDLVSTIKGKRNYIDYVKNDVERQKLELSQLTDDVNKKIDELNKDLSEKQEKVKELENSKTELKANSDELTKQREDAIKKIDEEIEKAYKAALAKSKKGSTTVDGTVTEFTGGNFAWPVPGYNTITTTFGFVYYLVNPNGSPHTGCDIAGASIFGKPIVAAEAGTVIVAGYNAGGYGNYVMIDHGKCTDDNNNYISLYGHASALAVQAGQHVEKGDVVAYVGSTGNSTGPHVHYEMRINGKITDPLVQYPGMSFNIL